MMPEGNTIQEYKRNRFVFEIDGVDLPPWIISELAYSDGIIVVIYREIKGFFTSEYFDNNANNIVGKDAKLKLIDNEGYTIGEILFTGVNFQRMEMDALSYDKDLPLRNHVYFTYKSVKHRSV